MDAANLNAVPSQGRHLVFCDAVKDDLVVKDVTLQTCHFLRIGARDAVFAHSELTQCLFEDTYLRKARFSNVRLTGSTFRNCNLEKVHFQGCDLRYCSFDASLVDRNEIIENLPVEPNLRRELARNLRQNFEGLGDKKSADVFLDLQIEAHEQELLGAFRRKTEYYRTHYTPVDQAKAGLQYVTSRLSGLLWGYGHRVSRLILSYLVLTFALSLMTYYCRLPFVADAGAEAQTLAFWESVGQVFAATLGTTVTHFTPASGGAKALHIVESFVGTLFLAMLAAAAYRRIAR